MSSGRIWTGVCHEIARYRAVAKPDFCDPLVRPTRAGLPKASTSAVTGYVRKRTLAFKVLARSERFERLPIRNLLDGVVVAAREQAVPIGCIQKISEKEEDLPNLRFTTDNAAFLGALGSDCQVGGGTAWFWARPDASSSVDVLFIDEAAQMSLANVLAVPQAAQSIVLLGDPRQLEQPIQGSHPDGVDVSSLDHILGPHATVPADRGLFLAETWRLHPLICAFNSELFYESRLHPRAGLVNQTIRSKGSLNSAGLRCLSVEHHGNQSSSREEADRIRDLVAEILAGGSIWVDREGVEGAGRVGGNTYYCAL